MNSSERCPAISPTWDMRPWHVMKSSYLHLEVVPMQSLPNCRGLILIAFISEFYPITRNREVAEDALQDSFLRAYLALPSFEGRSKLSVWLARIGINSALMIFRRRRCRPETSFEQQQDFEGACASVEIPDDALNPEQVYDQQQRCHAIRRALQRLDPKSRAAMGIRLSEEHSIKETAQDLGVSVASLKSRLRRARKRLLRSPALGTGRPVTSTGKKSSDFQPSCSLKLRQWAAESVQESYLFRSQK